MDESPLVTSAHVSGDIAAISDDEIDELALLEDARRIDPHMREYCEQLLGAQRREAQTHAPVCTATGSTGPVSRL